MRPRGTRLLVCAGLWLMLGCNHLQAKPLAPNAESLDSGKGASYHMQPDDVHVVEQHWPKRGDVTIVAVQKRPLTRNQLRAVARKLAGRAKLPTLDIYATDAAHGACTRNRFRVVRGNADPKDTETCYDGTVLSVSQTEPRIVYWGAGASAEE